MLLRQQPKPLNEIEFRNEFKAAFQFICIEKAAIVCYNTAREVLFLWRSVMGTVKKMSRAVCFIAALIVAASVLMPYSAAQSVNETKRYLGEAVNAGHDTGYSQNQKIKDDDPHFGWKLGSFYVDGYTRVTENKTGDPVFLKTVGDTVTLWFELVQDIDKLNGNDKLLINDDKNGYDEYFGIEKTDFGRGTLIVRHTDYRNSVSSPIIYTNYLAATATKDAAVEVKLCEEGDYEVALNYEIRKNNMNIFGWNPLPTYNDYRIFFRFSVRNGNCMVYPFDVATGAELTNSSITENGFYLDLARSRYLNIDIKKEIRRTGAEGLTEDTRFNKPAKDGEVYTDEGIYTITVSNLYTNQTTTKIIYVGTDSVLKAHVVTGLSIGDIESQLAVGASIADDGTLIPAPDETLPPVEPTEPPATAEPESTPTPSGTPVLSAEPTAEPAEKPKANFITWFIPVLSVVVMGGAVALVIINRKQSKTAGFSTNNTGSSTSADVDDSESEEK